MLLDKYNINFEDCFLIYKAQRHIEEETEGVNNDPNDKTQLVNSIKYKAILNNMKKSMSKITMN